MHAYCTFIEEPPLLLLLLFQSFLGGQPEDDDQEYYNIPVDDSLLNSSLSSSVSSLCAAKDLQSAGNKKKNGVSTVFTIIFYIFCTCFALLVLFLHNVFCSCMWMCVCLEYPLPF